MKKGFEEISTLNLSNIVDEFMKRNPSLFSCVVSAMMSTNNLISAVKVQEIIPRIAMVYSIIQQTNFAELSLLQATVSMMLQDAACEQRVSFYMYSKIM